MARVRLSVDVEPELKHRLAVLAALRGETMSEVVIEAVRNVLAEEGLEEPEKASPELAGVLQRYADKSKRIQEDSAWAEGAADDLH